MPVGSETRWCGQCLKSPPPWNLAISPLLYAWPLDQLLQHFKFNSDLAAGRLLGELLADFLAAGLTMKPDVLIPVPLHAARLRKRGFNQALELARPVARRLRLAIDKNLCVRIKIPLCSLNLTPRNVAAICTQPSQFAAPWQVCMSPYWTTY